MMNKGMVAAALAAITCMTGCGCGGAISVTASRDYVDRKTTLIPITNDNVEVGYVLSGQESKIIVSSNGLAKAISDMQDVVHTNHTGDVRINGSLTVTDRFSEGMYTTASGDAAHSEGGYTTASGTAAHAEGDSSRAVANFSHAEGYNVGAYGSHSHAEGASTETIGSYAHSEGAYTHAVGDASHSEGEGSWAYGYVSHAEGLYTTASNLFSKSSGIRSVVTNDGAYAWQGWNGVGEPRAIPQYGSHGPGTYNINPANGLEGFWIGDTNLSQHIRNTAPPPELMPVYSDAPTFSDWSFSGFTDGITVVAFYYYPSGYDDNGEWIAVTSNGDIALVNGHADDKTVFIPQTAWLASGTGGAWDVTATRTDIIGYTLPSHTDKVLAGTNFVIKTAVLTPVGTFSNWSISPDPDDSWSVSFNNVSGWMLTKGGTPYDSLVNAHDKNATNLYFSTSSEDFTVTRHVTSTVGYTLNGQTDKVLPNTNFVYAVAESRVSTNDFVAATNNLTEAINNHKAVRIYNYAGTDALDDKGQLFNSSMQGNFFANNNGGWTYPYSGVHGSGSSLYYEYTSLRYYPSDGTLKTGEGWLRAYCTAGLDPTIPGTDLNPQQVSGQAVYTFTPLSFTMGTTPYARFAIEAMPTAWVASTEYNVGVCVSSNGKAYRCKTVHTSGSTFNVTYWDEIPVLTQKQDALTFDATPTAGSNNPVTSGGVKAVLDGKVSTNDFVTATNLLANAKTHLVYNAIESEAADGSGNVYTNVFEIGGHWVASWQSGNLYYPNKTFTYRGSYLNNGQIFYVWRNTENSGHEVSYNSTYGVLNLNVFGQGQKNMESGLNMDVASDAEKLGEFVASQTFTTPIVYYPPQGQLNPTPIAKFAREASVDAKISTATNAVKEAADAYTDAMLVGKADKSAVDPLLFAQYYPDGSVTNVADFTIGIKYNTPDTNTRTITVKPFCNTGTAADDNSDLVGRVVIPPFVDASGKPYILDDGTRFKVVGVSASGEYDYNINLTAIVASTTLTTIGSVAFNACSSLTSVAFPGAESIGSGAFVGCSSLTSVAFPGAESIGSGAFGGCASLTSVSLPAATTIGEAAFAFCDVLASVDFGDMARTTVPPLGDDAFTDVPTSCKIIVPYTQYDAWTAASGWSSLTQEFVRHAEKADKPATFTTGNLAALDAQGNLTDSGKTTTDFMLTNDFVTATNDLTTAINNHKTVRVFNDSDTEAADGSGNVYTNVFEEGGHWVITYTPNGGGTWYSDCIFTWNGWRWEWTNGSQLRQGNNPYELTFNGWGAFTVPQDKWPWVNNVFNNDRAANLDGFSFNLGFAYGVYHAPKKQLIPTPVAKFAREAFVTNLVIGATNNLPSAHYIMTNEAPVSVSGNDSVSIALHDRGVTSVGVDFGVVTNTLRLDLPSAISASTVRDFVCVIEGTNSVGVADSYPEVTLYPSGAALLNSDGSFPDISTNGTTLLYFTEIKPNAFLLKGEQVKRVGSN